MDLSRLVHISAALQLFARKELNFERMSERDKKQIVAEVYVYRLCMTQEDPAYSRCQKYIEGAEARAHRAVS